MKLTITWVKLKKKMHETNKIVGAIVKKINELLEKQKTKGIWYHFWYVSKPKVF